jgi:hypothetical protein
VPSETDKFLAAWDAAEAKMTEGPWTAECRTGRGKCLGIVTPQHGGTFECQENLAGAAHLRNRARQVSLALKAAMAGLDAIREGRPPDFRSDHNGGLEITYLRDAARETLAEIETLLKGE